MFLSAGEVFSLVKTSAKREAALDDNRRAIEEASELGTDKIVLVCGADPAQPLEDSRKQIFEGISAIFLLQEMQE